MFFQRLSLASMQVFAMNCWNSCTRLGWASIGDSDVVYKMVMSIGWNPFYKNEKKTAEAWVLHEFPEVCLLVYRTM